MRIDENHTSHYAFADIKSDKAGLRVRELTLDLTLHFQSRGNGSSSNSIARENADSLPLFFSYLK